MMDKSGHVLSGSLPGPDPHLQRVEGEIRVQRGRHLPAHDHSRKHIDDERGIHPSRKRPDIGDVRYPELVGSEAAVDQVRRRRRGGSDGGPGLPASPSSLQALLAHQPLDRAASHADSRTVELRMHFPRSVNTVILAEHTLDLSEQFGVPHGTFRRRALLGRPEGSRGDPHIRIVQDCADRLDPELLPLDNPLAAAKNAEAVFGISFARRNSRTSRSSSAIRAASSLVRPGAVPASISARLTHVHNASGCTSNWPATRRIAAIR
jgi:hypothetical protein